LRGGYYDFRRDKVLTVPIRPTILSDNNTELIGLVNQILAAKKTDPREDTSSLEAEIDRLVYELYSLTEEEIRIVEGQLTPTGV
jgi:hypothetical protein